MVSFVFDKWLIFSVDSLSEDHEGAADFFGAIFTLARGSWWVKAAAAVTQHEPRANVIMAPKKSAAPSGRRLCSTSPH